MAVTLSHLGCSKLFPQAWRDFSRLGRGSGYYRKGAFVSKFTMDFQRGYYLPTKDGCGVLKLIPETLQVGAGWGPTAC